MNNTYIWLGILFCALNAAMFSGLNLALFRISDLRLKVLAKQKNYDAIRIQKLREKPTFLLATILWANVAYNVMLTLLSNSVMAGVVSFLFSTIVLTFVGEIFPQALFSRYALPIGGWFEPLIRWYQFLLYPVAKPTAYLINRVIGKPKPTNYTEQDLIEFIKEVSHSEGSEEISKQEALGAIHFLELDDKPLNEVGTKILEKDLVRTKFNDKNQPEVTYTNNRNDPFLKKLNQVKHEKAIVVDQHNTPRFVVDTDLFFRKIFMSVKKVELANVCHIPYVIYKENAHVSDVLSAFATRQLEHRIVVLWNKKQKRILSSDDILYLLTKEA